MSLSRFSFLRRVRIHDGECGAVARALHHTVETKSLPAALGKVSSATLERKVMSKTTFFKRIALVAIASLGFGTFSAIPSQATVVSHTLTIDSATDTLSIDGDSGDSATAVLTHSFVNLSSMDSVTLRAIVTSSNASTAGTIMMSVTDSYTSVANDATEDNSPVYTFGGSRSFSCEAAGVCSRVNDATLNFLTTTYGSSSPISSSSQARDSMTIHGAYDDDAPANGANRSIGSVIQLKLYGIQAAGTYTVSVFTLTSDSGAAAVSATPTVTWTVTATAPSKTATADSTATLRQGNASTGGTYWNGTGQGVDSQTLAAATATTTDVTPEFTVVVDQANGTSTNTAQESFTVTVSGEAWVTTAAQTTAMTTRLTSASSTAQKALTFAYPTAGTPVEVHLWSTGTAGTATVTISTTSGLSLGSKTITFHGTVSALAVGTVFKKVLRAGSATAQTGVLTVLATDSGGRAVTTAGTLSITSSDVTQIVSGTCTDAYGTAVTDGTYTCDVTGLASSTSGKAVTLTITDGYLELTSTTSAHTMGGAVSTVVLTTDKSTYEPGEVMTITATAKDSSGNTPYDGQSGPSLSFNKSAGAAISMSTYLAGVSTSNTRSSAGVVSNTANLFAPAASGKFTVSGLDGQTTPAAISVSATVADDAATQAANAASDAALEAIDAANAATDAANLAAEAADAATVAAEEARDAADAATAAVEALASEVATLTAALKAQITALANTVAKIAKKVKA